MKVSSLYRFTSHDGNFRVENPDRQGPVYFPLANEAGLLSSITPDLQGDIKLDQNTFLNHPVAFEDLHLSRSSRNFWISIPNGKKAPTLWSVTGRSVWQRAAASEATEMEAGLLWQRVTRKNPKLGLEASVLSFVPVGNATFEVMRVEIKNTSRKKIRFTPTAAIPLFGRSADSLRDHRHVTSLLNRVKREPFGLHLSPTMLFNERGHSVINTTFFVVGADDDGTEPSGIYPTVESFIEPGGDLERPGALLNSRPAPEKIRRDDQGKEALGGLQFDQVVLAPGKIAGFTLLIGVESEPAVHDGIVAAYTGAENVAREWSNVRKHWDETVSQIKFETGDASFNRWARWVQVQPVLRKIFGCSFLPDFDYGRGGRGWRDLWQDCLALLLLDPADVREDLLRNFGGVRMDGSNATIIGRRKVDGKWIPEFIADRNNITRTWMDHGIWPFLTTNLYLQQTGDWKFLMESMSYFQDALLERGKKVNRDFRVDADSDRRGRLVTRSGAVYIGTILEHVLVQTLVPFFNVGEHNNIRLEDADWNDGLDMAHQRGESVAFTAFFAGNLSTLADTLETAAKKSGWSQVEVAEELLLLLDRLSKNVDYDSIEAKKSRLLEYFEAVGSALSGKTAKVSVTDVTSDLRAKADWIRAHLNKSEWIEAEGHGWYNGYYDNQGRRVEGVNGNGRVRMTLSGQVYPIMAGVADDKRVMSVIRAVDRYLWDKNLGGVRLNNDFGGIQPDLGRAFAFAFGEKENGAVFSHMAVMYANALYQRGFAAEGHRVLRSLYEMAENSGRSRIFPGLPEYFNNQGRGRYAYLTGSASWYVMTLLTQVFGVRGEGGDLRLAPRLEPSQYNAKGEATVTFSFAEARVTVTYRNKKKLPWKRTRIKAVMGAEGEFPVAQRSDHDVLIQRDVLATRPEWKFTVELEEKKD